MQTERLYKIQEYDPKWKDVYLNTVEEIQSIFGDFFVHAEHVGSTSVPGMFGKPQVDLAIEVRDFDSIGDYDEAFKKKGYTIHGTGYVTPDDYYISKEGADGTRFLSVHIFQEGNPKIQDYRVFREFLTKNEKDRNQYIKLKKDLQSVHPDNYNEYVQGKQDFIENLKIKAKHWYSRGNNIPIIFIHYSDSEYLRYSLSLAKKTNPDKRVILLGDESNKHYEKYGIEHYMFEDYFKGPEVETFERVYQFIAGESKRKSHWTNFVFKRWFCMYNFIKDQGIERFWTFDTDTLILKDLSSFEETFADYDCTSQCNNWCVNGLINNQKVVKGYIDTINELFQRPEYLDKQREEMKENPDWAFTEMRAFVEYVKEENPNVFYLKTHRSGTYFDECICQEDGMEMKYSKRAKRDIKKLYFEKGSIYEKEQKTGKPLQLQTINMSWVPLFHFEQIHYYTLGKGRLYAFFASLIRSLKNRFHV